MRDGERIRAERRFRTPGRPASSGASGRRIRRRRTGRCRTAPSSSPPSTASSPTANRAEALWDFRYRLEMFVPKAKREYGYYVLPLLVGDQIVGRAEPRFDRKTGTLELLGAWGDTSRLDEALDDLAAWLGAASISR